MKVHIQQIPPDGLHLEGEEPSGILDLNDDAARPTGPIVYSLEVGLSDGGLFATGTLSTPLDVVCVACLEHFPLVLKVPNSPARWSLPGVKRWT